MVQLCLELYDYHRLFSQMHVPRSLENVYNYFSYNTIMEVTHLPPGRHTYAIDMLNETKKKFVSCNRYIQVLGPLMVYVPLMVY